MNKNLVTTCTKEIAAYAVDQCISMANTQNDAAGTTMILVGAASVGAALATDIYALHNPTGTDKTATAALAAAVTANGANLPKLFPAFVAVKPGDIITAATSYSDAVNITSYDFQPCLESDLSCKNGFGHKVTVKLARIHDAALSACPAVAFHRIVRPKAGNL